MEVLKEQVKGLEEVKGVSRYSSRGLFECLDNNQEELAKYLVLRGFRTNIWKQVIHHLPVFSSSSSPNYYYYYIFSDRHVDQ